jgi:VCBS repeat-containing protein
MVVTDVNGNASAQATRTIAISPHQIPQLTLTTGSLSYIQGRPATLIDPDNFFIVDGDSTNLARATAQVNGGAGGYVNGQDVLGVSDPLPLPGGIVATFTPGSGLLTLTGPAGGTASLTNFQAALRRITYVNNAAGATGTRTVTFQVFDDTNLGSSVVTRTITINTGQPPALLPVTGVVSYPQGGAPAVVDSGIQLDDPDKPGSGPQIASAVVRFTAGYVNTQDVLGTLAAGFPGVITPIFDPSNGTLTLSGNASVQNYQDALQRVTYQNLLTTATGSRTLIITATDINANTSTSITRTVQIVEHVAPTITPPTGILSYPRGAPATVIDGVALAVSDSDSPLLTSGRVVVSDGYVNGQDVLDPTGLLLDTVSGSITASFIPGNGTLSLTGSGTPAEYATAFHLVRYRNTNGSASGNRTVSFFVTDATGLTSQAATRTVTIVSQAVPVIAPSTGTLSFSAGSAATAIDGSFTIADSDSANLNNTHGLRVTISPYFGNQDRLAVPGIPAAFTGIFDVNTGVLTVDCTGGTCPKPRQPDWEGILRTITYQNILPNPDTTIRTISIVATDTDGNASAPATRTVTLIGAATPPTLTGLTPDDTIDEDTSRTYSLTVGDLDTPIGDLSIATTSSDQAIVPNAGLSIGGVGGSRTLTVTPTANRFTRIAPAAGTPVTITVSVTDGTSTTSQTLNLTINAVNDAPTISDITDKSTVANTAVAIPFTVADPDDAASTLTVALTSSNTALVPNSPSSNIVFTGSGGSRSVSITPLANQTGATLIGLTVSDASTSAVDFFTLTVNPTGAPTISAIGPQTTARNTATPPIAFTIADPDTALGSLQLSHTSSNPAVVEDGVAGSSVVFGGTGPNRTVAITPKTGAVGSTTISINVSDGPSTATTTFVLSVTPGGPAVTTNNTLSVARGGFATIGSALLVAADPDTAALGLTFTIASPPGTGTLRKNGSATSSFTQDDVNNGRISYLHNGSVFTSDSFNFTVTDGTNTTALAVFAIQVTNDSLSPATIKNTGLTLGKGTTATVTRSMLELGDANTPVEAILFSVLPGPANGTLKKNGASAAVFSQADINAGLISYQHDGSATSADAFTFTATDGTNTTGAILFSITIVGTNNAPTLAVATGVSVGEGKSVKLDPSILKATDTDNSPSQLVYTVTTAPTHGGLRRNNQPLVGTFTQAEVDAGSISYVHDGTKSASDNLAVRVSDGTNQTAIASLPITVGLVNSVPTITKNVGLTVIGGSTSPIGNGVLAATDVDNTPTQLVYTLVVDPSAGEIRRGSTKVGSFSQEDIDAGRVSYVHTGTPTVAATDTFTFTLSDGTNTLGRTTFSITINAAILPPTTFTCPLTSNIVGSSLDLTPVSSVLNGVRTATVCTDLKIRVPTSAGTVVLEIPANTKLSAPAVRWDGQILLPFLGSSSGVTPPTLNGRPSVATQVLLIGADSMELSADGVIQVTLPGQAGHAAAIKHGSQFTMVGADSKGSDLVISSRTLGGTYVAYTDGCTPRPNVVITSSILGSGADKYLQGKVTVTSGASTAVNRLLEVKLSKKSANAQVEVAGNLVNLTDGGPNDWLSLPMGAETTSYTFTIRRINPALGVTVNVVAVDVCGGDWRTFVGAGPDAFK